MTVVAFIKSVIISLVLTEAAELLIARLCKKSPLWLVGAANLLTNPVVVAVCLIVKYSTALPYAAAVVIMETAAVLAEGALYSRYSPMSRPYMFSAIANALSFGIGVVIAQA